MDKHHSKNKSVDSVVLGKEQAKGVWTGAGLRLDGVNPYTRVYSPDVYSLACEQFLSVSPCSLGSGSV